jgi:hypothetical protein
MAELWTKFASDLFSMHLNQADGNYGNALWWVFFFVLESSNSVIAKLSEGLLYGDIAVFEIPRTYWEGIPAWLFAVPLLYLHQYYDHGKLQIGFPLSLESLLHHSHLKGW